MNDHIEQDVRIPRLPKRVQTIGGRAMSEIPERIYLQWDPHPDADEITWCVDMVAEGESVDIEYIRADLFTAEDIADALAEAGEWWLRE